VPLDWVSLILDYPAAKRVRAGLEESRPEQWSFSSDLHTKSDIEQKQVINHTDQAGLRIRMNYLLA
jgi:hypothetical protein